MKTVVLCLLLLASSVPVVCAQPTENQATSQAASSLTNPVRKGSVAGILYSMPLPERYVEQVSPEQTRSYQKMWMDLTRARHIPNGIYISAIADPAKGTKYAYSLTEVAQTLLKGKAQNWADLKPGAYTPKVFNKNEFVVVHYSGHKNDPKQRELLHKGDQYLTKLGDFYVMVIAEDSGPEQDALKVLEESLPKLELELKP